MERLQKFLASSGIASRRACEELIAKGKIKVNGEVVSSLGTKVDPDKDKIEYNGKEIVRKDKKIYIKLNKPEGYITSCRSNEGPTVFEFLKGINERIFPIGRLDKDTSGLLLLTNDGDLALRLSHPRYEHEKEYECETEKIITEDQVEKLRNGIDLVEGKTLPAKIKKTGPYSFKIIIKEGKNRQIKRMVRIVGNRIKKLKRIRIVDITLGNLPESKWRLLDAKELQSIL